MLQNQTQNETSEPVRTRRFYVSHFGEFANIDASDENIARDLIAVRLPISRGPGAVVALIFLALSVAFFGAFALGAVPLAPYLVVQSFYFFILAQACHEAIDGALHRKASVNRGIGHLIGFALLLTVKMTQRQHVRYHHARNLSSDFMHRDDPTEFPSALGALWHALHSCFGCAWRMRAESLRNAPQERFGVVGLVLFAAISLVLWPKVVFFGWLLPMHVGVALFWLIGGWLPHTYFGMGRTPRVPAWMPDWLLHLITFYHEDHHLHPAYPAFQWPVLWWRRAQLLGRMTPLQIDFVVRELRICKPHAARLATARRAALALQGSPLLAEEKTLVS